MRSILSLFLCFATLAGCKTFSSLESKYPDKKTYFLYIKENWKKCEAFFIYPLPKSQTELAYYSDRYLIGLSQKEVILLLGNPHYKTDTTLTYKFVCGIDCPQTENSKPSDWTLFFQSDKFKFSYKPPLLDPQ